MHFAAAAFGALAGAMLIFPQQAAEAAQKALALFAYSVAPALGPFMVCMLMLSSRIRGCTIIRVFLAWLCASPGGGKIMLQIQPEKKTALRFAAVTGTMSPMFFLGVVAEWLQNPRAGIVILACHLLSACLLYWLLPREEAKLAAFPVPLPLASAIRDSALSLLSIAVCMMLGCVAAKMAACALPHLPESLEILLQCALEITAGAERIAQVDTPLKIPLLCGACSFGGLSLLMQNAAVWQTAEIRIGTLFLLRLSHGVIAFALCSVLWHFFA